jgi:outer membrane receptor protein involved in Fe transport
LATAEAAVAQMRCSVPLSSVIGLAMRAAHKGLPTISAVPFCRRRVLTLSYYGAYAQDSWRVNSRLTLNYGLRYDYWSPFLLPRHNLPYFNEVTGELRYVLQSTRPLIAGNRLWT